MKSKMFKNTSGFVYGSGNLVQFRAGRMNVIGKMVHADTRKGLIYVRQAEDGLLHFCWKDRDTDKIEDDLILFPEDFEYKRVDQCKTGRVYVMKFKTSPRRMFYWMQEIKSNKDEQYCTRINELIKNPPPASQQRATNGVTSSLYNNLTHQQLVNLFNDISQKEKSAVSSGSASMGTLVSASSTINTNGVVSTATKGAVSLFGENNVANSSKKQTIPKKNKSADKIDLIETFTDFITSNQFLDVISNNELVNKLAMLLPKVEGENVDSKQLIMDHLSTPEFQQSMSEFYDGFPSKILEGFLKNLQLPASAVIAASSGNLESFFRALEINSGNDVIMGDVGENNKNSKRGDKRKREPEPDEHNSKRK